MTRPALSAAASSMRTPRPTRGSTRRALGWSGLTLVCLLGLFGARAGQDAAHDRELDAATARAVAAAERIADRTGPAVDAVAPGAGVEELLVMLRAEVLTDPTIGSVRVYGADGTLRFATDRAAQAAIGERVQNGAVRAALGGQVERREAREPFTPATTGELGPETDLVRVFVPLRADEEVVGVVQADFLADELRAAAAGPWPSVQLGLGLALLVCLGMTVVLWVPRRREDTTEDTTEDTVVPALVAEVQDVAAPDAPRPGFEERIAELEGRLAQAERAAEEARGVLAAGARSAGASGGSDDPRVLLETLAGREESENEEEGADLRMRLGRAFDLKMMRDKDR